MGAEFRVTPSECQASTVMESNDRPENAASFTPSVKNRIVLNATAVSSGIARSDALAVDVDVVREGADIDAHADRRTPGERRQRRRGAGPAIAERLIHAADAPPDEIDADSSRRRAGAHLRAVAELHVHRVSVVAAGLRPVELELPLQVSRGNFGEAVRHERPHHGV